MYLKVHIVTIFLILYNRYDFASSNPMFGENVRFSYAGEFPFVVSIKRMNPENEEPETDHICTGVLVSNQDIVTIHHCFQFLMDYMTEVVIGSHNIRNGRKYYVSWWIPYNEWTFMKNIMLQHSTNDITIIRLNETVPDDVRPVALTSLPDLNLVRTNVQVAGFGISNTGRMTRLMETAEMTIISRRECEHRVERLRGCAFVVSEKYLCGASDPVVLMSNGNSGSAVLYNGELIGIHRGTSPSHEYLYHPEKVNLIVSINFYKTYIQDVIANF